MKMFNIPFCAYLVQMATTFLLSATEAFSTPSCLILALMNSTARYAPVVTAWVDAPVSQQLLAPPEISPGKKGAATSESLAARSMLVGPSGDVVLNERIIWTAQTTSSPIG